VASRTELSPNVNDRAHGETGLRRPGAERADRRRRGRTNLVSRAYPRGREPTAVAPWSPLLRTQIEILTFSGGDETTGAGLLRRTVHEEIAIGVGGLVYGFEKGRWVFRGIREAYLSSRWEQGRAGVGQVLDIDDADAKIVQRNLHASLGRRTYLISGVCSGGVARKLRQYLRSGLGSAGLRPIHPLDLGKQLDTRGWVVQRNAYPAVQPAGQPAIQTPRLTPGPTPPPQSPATGESRPGPPKPEDGIAATAILPVARAPPNARRTGAGAVRAISRRLAMGFARGRTTIRDAARALGKRTKPESVASPNPGRPAASEPTGSRTVLPAAVAAGPRVRPPAHATVKMQLRPPSRPPRQKPGVPRRSARGE